MRAITQASAIVHWQENLPKDEVPPKWMWHLDHELELWFEQVERDREDRMSGTTSGGDMLQNEMIKR